MKTSNTCCGVSLRRKSQKMKDGNFHPYMQCQTCGFVTRVTKKEQKRREIEVDEDEERLVAANAND